MTDLTSRRNPQIRLVRSLRRAKGRRETGLFMVEGLRHIGELLASDFTAELILYAPDGLTSEYGAGLLDQARRAGITLLSTTEALLDDLSDKNSASGMIAVARQTAGTFDRHRAAPGGWSIALVTPQDPGNLGTILRTMDAFQAADLLLLDGGADPWQPTTVRASMGAIFTHPVVEGSFAEFTAWASANGRPIYGTSAHAAEDVHTLGDAPTPAVLLFGSERDGLTTEQQAACTQVVRIPIHGRGTSLNIAVAAGIALFSTIEN